jgi:hypothetical protein
MQPAQLGPPQSVSVSVPFLTPSLQAAAWQTPLLHTLLVQSPPITQARVAPQGAHAPPPQSVSVSVPFLIASLHVAVMQARVVASQLRLTQSAGKRQFSKSSHGGQLVPPQSTSVSVPFRNVSVQPGIWHTAAKQKPVVQSFRSMHVLPGPQLVAQVPPQSTSVSVPFFTPSAQSAATQVWVAPHTRLLQSSDTLQP